MLVFQTKQEQLIQGKVALSVSVQGSVDSKNTIHQFDNQLQDYLKVGHRFVILDCSGLKFINSSGLQILLKMVETYQQAGGIFLLIKVLPQISKFFDMVGFTPIFTFFTTKEEAIVYLKNQVQKIAEQSLQAEANDSVSFDAAVPSLPQVQNVAGGQAGMMQAPPGMQAGVMQPPPGMQPLPGMQAGVMQPLGMQAGVMQAPPGMQPANFIQSPMNFAPMTPQIHQSAPVMGSPVHKVQGNFEMEIGVDYYKKAYPWDIFPIKVSFSARPQNKKTEEHVWNLAVYCPGCIVVPEYRTFYVKQNTEITFWMTPIVCKKVNGWLEIWHENESATQFEFQIRIGRQRLSAFFMILALSIFSICALPIQEILGKIPIVQQIFSRLGTLETGLLAATLFLFMAIVSFIMNRPKRAQPVRQQIVFNKGN